MGEKTHIQWTDATWNPVAGCSIKSPGCTNCYAMQLAGTRLAQHPMYSGTTDSTKRGPVFNGVLKEAAPDHPVWNWPLTWRGPQVTRRGAGARPLVFVGDMSDLAHENRSIEVIDKVWARMAVADHIDFQILTKRPEVLRKYLDDDRLNDRLSAAVGDLLDGEWIWKQGKKLRHRIEQVIESLLEGDRAPLPNVWIGTSTEDQMRANERIPHLLQTPAAVRFISAEPLLGEIDLSDLDVGGGLRWNALGGRGRTGGLDWVIVGGESGNRARNSVIGHQRSLIEQCRSAGVAVFEKQLGAKPVNREGVGHAISTRAGGELSDFPEDLRIRQFPQVAA